jgi:transcriptional regulator GlxA family with amidase domain
MMARVLIVEDERIVARDLSEILEELGHSVAAIASSYEEGVYALNEAEVDLALIDVRIDGDKDGISFAVELREEHDCALAFITSHADAQTIDRAASVRPNGYLVKPYSERSVHALVETALANYSISRSDIDHAHLAEANGDDDTGLTPSQRDKVIGCIDRKLDEALTVPELADLCGMKPTLFSRRFKTSFGKSPYQYVLDQRLAEAKRLLRNSDWPLAQVALATGFSNQAHFSTTFHRAAKVTPSAYRKSATHYTE